MTFIQEGRCGANNSVNIDDIDNLRSSDQIFSSFLEHKRRVIDALLFNINDVNVNNISHTDQSCRFYDYVNSRPNSQTASKFYKCESCIKLDRIIYLDGKFNTNIIRIKAGRFTGKEYVIDCSRKRPRFINNIGTDDKLEVNDVYSSCEVSSTKDEFESNMYETDSYTGKIIVNLMAGNELKKYMCPGINPIVYSFICQKSACIISENTVNLDEFEWDSRKVKGAMKHLTFTLDILKSVNFSIGKIPNLITGNYNQCNYEYSGNRVDSEITLMLNNFDMTSITIGEQNNRVMSRNYIGEYSMIQSTFDNISHKIQEIEGELTYKLDSSIYFDIIKSRGVPLYKSSINIYICFLYLMSHRKIFDIVINEPHLENIWKSMFIADEYDSITNSLNSFVMQERQERQEGQEMQEGQEGQEMQEGQEGQEENNELIRANFIEKMLIKHRMKCMMIPKMVDIFNQM